MKKFISLSLLLVLMLTIGTRAFAEDSARANVGVEVHAGFLNRIFGDAHNQDSRDQNADDQDNDARDMHNMMPPQSHPNVYGTISAINGTTLTVSGMQSMSSSNASSTANYAIDASHATILYRGTQSMLSNLKVGDKVAIKGTVNGTTVTATTISAGLTIPGSALHDVFPGTVGKVTAVNGSTITIASQPSVDTQTKTKTTTTFTVNASNASIQKNAGGGTLSDITVGTNILVQGTVSGTTITATKIYVWDAKGMGAIFPGIQNNGQPIIDGKITAINGNSITVVSANSVTYSIDATNTKVSKADVTTATVSNLAVGDNVLIQGTVNGNAVVAASIIDHPVKTAVESHPGFFHALGGFFSRIFGKK